MARPRFSSVLSTGSLVAHLTQKQAEMLVILVDGPQTTREISDHTSELNEDDIAMGYNPPYYGTSPTSIYSSMKTLEGRDLVVRLQDGKWALTPKGRVVCDTLI